jgi:lysozyme family protein
MSAKFEAAYRFVQEWEGGFVDNPSDPGGATNHGISLRWLKSINADINADGAVNADDIRALTPAQAKLYFYEHFWLFPGLERLPLRVGVVMFDGSVNMGLGRAIRLLQGSCNILAGINLRIDGVMGPETIKTMRRVSEPDGGLTLCKEMLSARAGYYKRLAQDKRKLKTFLHGWLNRTKALSGYILQLTEDA